MRKGSKKYSIGIILSSIAFAVTGASVFMHIGLFLAFISFMSALSRAGKEVR